jgi:hypothetical protein
MEITEYHVLGLICAQKGHQITRLDVFSNFLEKLSESLHLKGYYVKKKKSNNGHPSQLTQ